ncbi:hypothetical protein ACI6QG_13705 [Roseococcus sp. DSY-14]|uniref:hypothetical protein n=1 Tax=Roseococcus sp. DSY-14 TaxID=3369650 RepID=UPI00387B66F6
MRGAALALLLGGCAPVAAVLDPPLAQLARWESATDAAIAAEAPRCPPGHPACFRLHARRAEACMALAMAARAPGAACPPRSDHLDCAAAGYAAARALRPDPRLAAGEAQAALCLGDLSGHRAATQRAALAAREAGEPLLMARAALALARPPAPPAERCAIARAALPLAPLREAADLARRIALDCEGDPR